MTLLAPEEVAVERPVPSTGGARRWWRSWRAALRLARRDAWRDKWRSLLVIVLIFAPVAVLTGVDVYVRTSQVTESGTYQALLKLGRLADARVVAIYDSPAVQSPDGFNTGRLAEAGSLPDIVSPDGTSISTVPATDEQPITPTAAKPRFPSGWHAVPVSSPGLTVHFGRRAWTVDGVVADTRDSLVAGTYDLASGRLPDATGEVAVSQRLAEVGGLSVGSELTASYLSDGGSETSLVLTVVGVADPTDEVGRRSLVLQPGQLPEPAGPTTWLVHAPEPLRWTDVRALNQEGLALTSRAVLAEPPSFCLSGQLCLDDRPVRELHSSDGAVIRAEEVTALALIAVMALLQVALLAGPAFAVSLRRRQRDLALIAASGGTGADLRRAILASAVVLGATAGAAAVAAAVVAVGIAAPWLARWGNGVPLPGPVVMPEVFALAGVALVAALCAAAVPARIASRTDTLHALRGRRPAGPVRRGFTWTGIGLVVLGTGLVVWGVISLDAVGAVGGALALQVGVILLVPRLLVTVGRIGAALPVMLRISMRDNVRNRLRTVCAVSAITAATIGASAALIATTSYSNGSASFYVPRAQPGVLLVYLWDSAVSESGVRATLQAAVPTAAVSAAQIGMPTGDEASSIVLSTPGCDLIVTSDGMTFDSVGTFVDPWDPGNELSVDQIRACQANGRATSWWDVVRAGPAWVSAVTGTDSPQVTEMLSTGGAVAWDPATIGPHGVTFVTQSDGHLLIGEKQYLPAVALSTPMDGPRTVVGPQASLRGWTFSDSGTIFAILPAAGSDLDDVEARVQAAVLGLSDSIDDQNGSSEIYVERGYIDDTQGLALALVGGTALLALVAALSVTALALADARPDLATMAAVGAAPLSRRRYAAGTALLVTGLGTVLGIAASVVPAWAVSRTLTVAWGDTESSVDGFGRAIHASEFFTIPWLPLLLLGAGVPLVAAAVAWVFTRSRVPMTRRVD